LATITPAFLSPMKAMNRPTPAATCRVKLGGNGADDHLANSGRGQYEEGDSREEDCSEGDVPIDMHAENNRIRKVRVQSHAWSKGNWVAGEQAHQQTANTGGQDRWRR